MVARLDRWYTIPRVQTAHPRSGGETGMRRWPAGNRGAANDGTDGYRDLSDSKNMIRTTPLVLRPSAFGRAFAACLLCLWAAAAEKAPFLVPTGQRQLFLDDVGLSATNNLKRTMHRPVKKGAVLRPTPPHEVILQTRSAPAWDEKAGLYKLWLYVSGTAGYSGVGYAESRDGLHWIKPVLEQREVLGSRRNNLLVIPAKAGRPPGELGNVVIDPDEPNPERRFKALSYDSGLRPLVSPDGIHWRALDVPAIPSSDESNLSYDRDARTFIAMVKTGGPFGRAFAVSTSQDFEHWTPPELVFHADELDQTLGRARISNRLADPRFRRPEHNRPDTYNVDIYNMGVFRYEGLYVGLPTLFHRTAQVPRDWPGFDELNLSPANKDAVHRYGDWTGFHIVQMACSRDLKQWTRLGDREPFLDASPVEAGAYDEQVIISPSSPVPQGDELWFYYTGIKRYAFVHSGMERGYEDYYPDAGAICVAALRRDGFVSLDADAQGGMLLTDAFPLPGRTLRVNIDAPKGSLTVEVLGQNEEALAVSGPVSGDLTDGVVKWREGGLDGKGGTRVQLRLRLRDAQVYSYWFE